MTVEFAGGRMETYDGPARRLTSTLCGESATRSFVRASRGQHSFLLGCRDVPQYKVMKYLVFGVISSSLLPHMTTRIRMRMQSIPDRAF
jgi:hypothetical protein